MQADGLHPYIFLYLAMGYTLPASPLTTKHVTYFINITFCVKLSLSAFILT